MKNIFMRKINYVLLFVFYNFYAQNYNSSTPVHYPMSSTVWEFAKYGNVPVDEYRGLANISVPLYNIKVDNVEMPLNLNYYSGGIKVSEEASIVGLGWNFNLPTIIQDVKDKVDFDRSTKHQRLPPFQGNPALPDPGYSLVPCSDAIYNNPLNQFHTLPEIGDMPFLTNVVNNKIIQYNGYYNVNLPEEGKYKYMFEDRSIDTEPDIFNVTINGIEIKFCRTQSLHEEYNPLAPFEILPVKIINGRTEYQVEPLIFDVQVGTYEILAVGGFKIIDPSKNQYYFEKIEKIDCVGCSSYPINFMYKLTKIVTNLNKEIIFSYLPNEYVSETSPLKSKYARISDSYSSDNHSICGGFYTGTVDNQIICGGSPNSNEAYCLEPSSYLSQNLFYLNAISTPNETINLSYENRLDNSTKKKLIALEVKNIFNQKTKKYSFGYDYFTSNDNATNRLKLISLIEEGSQPYLFEYNSTNLPSKNSFSIDYWGFYNGHLNENLKPNLTQIGYPQYTENINNDFNSNIDYTKACSLEKIIYPTKGYTTFEYETHQFDNLLFNTGAETPIINNGGGLRINTISNFNFDGTVADKTSYEYFGGKCITKRILTKSLSNKIFMGSSGSYGSNTNTSSIIISNLNNYLNNTPNSEGAYIGYDKVVMKKTGTIDIGRIEKQFSNNENSEVNPNNIFSYNTYAYTPISNFENGKVLEEKVYGSGDSLKSKKKFDYFNKVSDQGLYGMSTQNNGVAITDYVSISNDNQGTGSHYFYYFYPRTLAVFYAISGKTTYLKSEESSQKFNDKIKTIITNYDYDDKGNIRNLVTQENNAIFPNINIYSEENVYDGFNNLFQKSKKNNNLLTEVQNLTYEPAANSERLKKIEIFPKGNLSLNNKKMNYDLYDDQNNILQYHPENGINTCVIWGYNKTFPIAKVENISYSQISSYVANLQNLSNINNETRWV